MEKAERPLFYLLAFSVVPLSHFCIALHLMVCWLLGMDLTITRGVWGESQGERSNIHSSHWYMFAILTLAKVWQKGCFDQALFLTGVCRWNAEDFALPYSNRKLIWKYLKNVILLGCLKVWAICIVGKEADVACSSEKIQINSLVLAVSRVLGGLLWYLHEHCGNLILMTQIQVLLACKEKNVQSCWFAICRWARNRSHTFLAAGLLRFYNVLQFWVHAMQILLEFPLYPAFITFLGNVFLTARITAGAYD